MAIPRTVPAALGAVAFLPTTALLALHVVLARSPEADAVRATGVLAAVLQAVLVVSIPVVGFGQLVGWTPSGRIARRAWFAAGLGWCVVAAVVSVGNVVCLTRVVDEPWSTVLGARAWGFLVGAAATLGVAFASQFLFFIFHLMSGRAAEGHPQISTHHDLGSQSSTRIKPPALAYLKTTRVLSKDFGSMSFDCPTPPASIAERPATGVLGSVRRAFEDAFRPITSRTRGLNVRGRSARRPRSIHLSGPLHEARSRSTSDGFDSWDTSAVDPEHRQTVIESSTQPNRGLETIPASPPASRSPSPGVGGLDLLEPPRRTRRRSRSYSPVSTRAIQAQRAAFTMQHASQSEAHIHPLFRSDSPTPPPSATPGTVVVAAPNAGQVISDRVSLRSIQSMRRLRSDSIPAVPSPLSRPGSCKSSLHKRGESGAAEIEEEDGGETPKAASPTEPAPAERERKMTPPIPDWILTAGLRLSLAAYNARKSRTSEGSEEEPPVAAMV
ncbi:hypothetical protein C8A05DRAFT_16714 [Staphylotrichum tortipilum]|uniref:Uncharacterized protein n=1 Tax=Staphylotrichum tortipilum TaxID=2831512 RepID=A0AAN6MHP0_9PEZI|nr:hypothetical protein C8A05DRAFT_16714 [Staphylotrichum longicolle]